METMSASAAATRPPGRPAARSPGCIRLRAYYNVIPGGGAEVRRGLFY